MKDAEILNLYTLGVVLVFFAQKKQPMPDAKYAANKVCFAGWIFLVNWV